MLQTVDNFYDFQAWTWQSGVHSYHRPTRHRLIIISGLFISKLFESCTYLY